MVADPPDPVEPVMTSVPPDVDAVRLLVVWNVVLTLSVLTACDRVFDVSVTENGVPPEPTCKLNVPDMVSLNESTVYVAVEATLTDDATITGPGTVCAEVMRNVPEAMELKFARFCCAGVSGAP